MSSAFNESMRARLTSAVSSARAMVIVSEAMGIQDCGPPNGLLGGNAVTPLKPDSRIQPPV